MGSITDAISWLFLTFITAGCVIDCLYTIVFWLFANTKIYTPGKGSRLSHKPIPPVRYFVALAIAAAEVTFASYSIPILITYYHAYFF